MATTTTTTASPSLERNLAALGRRNAGLVEAIRTAPPREGLDFSESPDGRTIASLDGRQLCSRRPDDESARLVDSVEVMEHGTFVFFGFGLGYHVERLARRIRDQGLIILFEPDLSLLRSVLEEIDHSEWLETCRIVLVADPAASAELALRLNGLDLYLGLGMEFITHPASRARLDESSAVFSRTLRDHVNTSRTMMMTTLVRSVDTARNLLLNLDHYVGGSGITDLKNAAAGYPAVLVAAGPSLQKNMHLLAQPGVRDRCVIISAQTTLKPLLRAGIRPHFVTALDFHEISKRFYEGLDPDMVRDVTLICEPKVNPVVVDAFPGPVRCCSSSFLDRILGPVARDMGDIPAGATVAHLSLHFARFLGCDPVIMIGQDLGFPDGLYYTSGTATHDVWAPELNPFNTIEMMEWRRVAAYRPNLYRKEDHQGRLIYSDAQLTTYLQQFEREFMQQEKAGLRVIDATEGGVRKQHTTIMSLREALDAYAQEELPPLRVPDSRMSPDRMKSAEKRLDSFRRDVLGLRDTCRRTMALLKQMLQQQHDQARMKQHFRKIDRYREDVARRTEVFSLLEEINQLGAFKRARADRTKKLMRDLDALEQQRLELERDLENVTWINDAAEEMISQLTDGAKTLRGEPVSRGRRSHRALLKAAGLEAPSRKRVHTIAALMPVDPERNGLGQPRSIAEPFLGRPVIQATLERLDQSEKLGEIVLIVPQDFDVESLLDRSRLSRTVTIERCQGSPFPPEHASVAVARAWASTCWRHGLGGASAYDEVLAPQIMSEIMRRREIDAAILVAPDWPLIDTSAESGCDAVIDRHLEFPEKRPLVFTQHPPGMGPCLVGRTLMDEMTERNRIATIGAQLTLQPHRPKFDIIAHPPCVQIDHRMRHSMIRATFDTAAQRSLLGAAFDDPSELKSLGAIELVQRIEEMARRRPSSVPLHVIIELTTRRRSDGHAHRHPFPAIEREPMTADRLDRILSACTQAGVDRITFGGVGDPLLHPDAGAMVRRARAAGVRFVHLRTELRVEQNVLASLVDGAVDVISVDLHANSPEVYQEMLGAPDFTSTLRNMEYIAAHQTRLTPQEGTAAMVVPWLVPRLQRCAVTYEEIEAFFDRWMYLFGAAVIDGEPDFTNHDGWTPDTLTRPVVPAQFVRRELESRLTVFSDGTVPVSEIDWTGDDSVGTVDETPLAELWRDLVTARRSRLNEADARLHPRICFA